MPLLEDEFGDIVAKARQGLGLSRGSVACAAGLQEADLAALESCQQEPTESEARALAGCLQLAPDKLWRVASGQWRPTLDQRTRLELAELEVVLLRSPQTGANCYIILPRSIESFIVVDPGVPAERILGTAGTQARTLTHVLITHGHHDHVQGLSGLQAAVPDCPVWVGKDEPLAAANRVDVAEGRRKMGALEMQVIETPGHTAGSLCFALPGLAFLGDHMFAGSLGRTRGGPDMYSHHLQHGRRILCLEADTLLLPGHGPQTTVADETAGNPFF